jgi:hypothetical protein
MSDREFLHALESCTLPESEFTHAAHVRAAYLYLCEHEFGAALARMAATIRRYATHLGKPDRYHETITVAYVALIREHIYAHGDGGGWEGFAAANPELFERELLLRFFPRSQLESDVARRIFVLPRARGVPT